MKNHAKSIKIPSLAEKAAKSCFLTTNQITSLFYIFLIVIVYHSNFSTSTFIRKESRVDRKKYSEKFKFLSKICAIFKNTMSMFFFFNEKIPMTPDWKIKKSCHRHFVRFFPHTSGKLSPALCQHRECQSNLVAATSLAMNRVKQVEMLTSHFYRYTYSHTIRLVADYQFIDCLYRHHPRLLNIALCQLTSGWPLRNRASTTRHLKDFQNALRKMP